MYVSITIIIHVQCRATLQAIGLYLEAFQKIADAATNSKGLLLHFIPDASLFVCLKCVCVFDCLFFYLLFTGATKDIGTALTRICLRQRAVESRVKSFTR